MDVQVEKKREEVGSDQKASVTLAVAHGRKRGTQKPTFSQEPLV